jgi:hypothetical protein
MRQWTHGPYENEGTRMNRPYKLLSIGLVVTLAAIAYGFVIHADRQPARGAGEADQHHVADSRVELPQPVNVSPQREAPQIAAPAPVRSGTSDAGQADSQNVNVSRATARPKSPLSPEHLTAHRAEERILVRREYSALFEMLNLSQQQEDDFLDVLVAERVAEPSAAEYRATRAKRARERTEKLTAIMGPEKMQIYENYLQNLSEYTRMAQVGMQLDAAGTPLTKQQKTFLVELMVAERERVPQPSKLKPIMTTADIEREIDWMADQDRRVSEGAASMLSATQLKYLDEVLAARLARRRVELFRIPVVE